MTSAARMPSSVCVGGIRTSMPASSGLCSATLREVAGRGAGKFSLGMSQRLGIAAALLGDPATVVWMSR